MKNHSSLSLRGFIATVVTLLVSLIVNDYVLENLLFPGNAFMYVNFFTAVELGFLTFFINVLMSFKAIGLLFRIFFSKEVKNQSPGLKKELRQVSWPVFPAMIIYGLLSGIVIYFVTQGYSITACIARATLLSAFWGMIYWYGWRNGYFVWMYDNEDEADDDGLEEPSEDPKKKNKSLNQTS